MYRTRQKEFSYGVLETCWRLQITEHHFKDTSDDKAFKSIRAVNSKENRPMGLFFPIENRTHSRLSTFFCNVLDIGKKRIRSSKASHKKWIRLTDEVKELINAYCLSIPRSESHYRREQSSLQYFENTKLTMKKLYELFLEFYPAKTGRAEILLTQTTYDKYFNFNPNFSFSKPRTDVCDFCFENKQNSEVKVC